MNFIKFLEYGIPRISEISLVDFPSSKSLQINLISSFVWVAFGCLSPILVKPD